MSKGIAISFLFLSIVLGAGADSRNWTESFVTKMGMATHTPDLVQIGQHKASHLLLFNTSEMDGVPLKASFALRVTYTRAEFVNALRMAGVLE